MRLVFIIPVAIATAASSAATPALNDVYSARELVMDMAESHASYYAAYDKVIGRQIASYVSLKRIEIPDKEEQQMVDSLRGDFRRKLSLAVQSVLRACDNEASLETVWRTVSRAYDSDIIAYRFFLDADPPSRRRLFQNYLTEWAEVDRLERSFLVLLATALNQAAICAPTPDITAEYVSELSELLSEIVVLAEDARDKKVISDGAETANRRSLSRDPSEMTRRLSAISQATSAQLRLNASLIRVIKVMNLGLIPAAKSKPGTFEYVVETSQALLNVFGTTTA